MWAGSQHGSQQAASSLSEPVEAGAHRGFFFPQFSRCVQRCSLRIHLLHPLPIQNHEPQELIQGIPPPPTESFLPCLMGMAPTLKGGLFTPITKVSKKPISVYSQESLKPGPCHLISPQHLPALIQPDSLQLTGSARGNIWGWRWDITFIL